MDKWLYFIKNLKDFQCIPEIFKNEVVFELAFKKAEIAKMTMEEHYYYEMSNKVVLDYEGGIRTAVNEARREEREAAKEEIKKSKYAIAKMLKDNGIAIQLIIQSTGLTAGEIGEIV